MEEAEYLCDRINMIYNGSLIAEGSPDKLKDNTDTDNLRDAFRACMKEAANE
jgi:sodium transport system ATP-binding protein